MKACYSVSAYVLVLEVAIGMCGLHSVLVVEHAPVVLGCYVGEDENDDHHDYLGHKEVTCVFGYGI